MIGNRIVYFTVIEDCDWRKSGECSRWVSPKLDIEGTAWK